MSARWLKMALKGQTADAGVPLVTETTRTFYGGIGVEPRVVVLSLSEESPA